MDSCQSADFEKQCKANARAFAEITQPQSFLGQPVHDFYLETWYNDTYGEWKPPFAWKAVMLTPWDSTGWNDSSSFVCEAMQDMWSKPAGRAALNNALAYNSNVTKTAFEPLPYQFKMALTHEHMLHER